jgi:ectoine hydroxylase-related dioxygenase (phytanoyl-CoA dioxygenase family)
MTHLEAASATVRDVLARLDEDGYAIVEGVLSPAELGAVKADLERLLADTPEGRNDFEGYSTRRVYAVFARTRVLDYPATHPLVLGVLDAVLGNYQLSQPVVIGIGPGETAQDLHCDDQVYPLPRPHDQVVVNVMWAIDDFTEENGATHVVPGSHRWQQRRPDARTATARAVMPGGSIMFFVGQIYHGGGANLTQRPRIGVAMEYCASWLRPQENHYLAVPRDIARGLDPRLQELLGYNLHGLLGNVDGRHPRKALLRDEPELALP